MRRKQAAPEKERIFFHPIEGSGALTISWSAGPKGDAIEAKKGSGVGFFSEGGDLLCVIFDEVRSSKDHQVLEFDQERVEISVKNGKVSFNLTMPKVPSLKRKKRVIRK